MDTNIAPYASIKDMLDTIGISPEDQSGIYQTYDLPRIAQHAYQTLWLMHYRQNILNPPAWLKASLRGNWSPPPGFEYSGFDQKTLHLRIDETTWAELQTAAPCPICNGDHAQDKCPAKGTT